MKPMTTIKYWPTAATAKTRNNGDQKEIKKVPGTLFYSFNPVVFYDKK